VAPALPKPGTGIVGKLKIKGLHVPSKGNTQCLSDLIVNKGLHEANHSNEKRQDLKRASMVIEEIEGNSTAYLGGVVEVPDLQNVIEMRLCSQLKFCLQIRCRQYSASSS
jgi:hypothetical protein